MEHAGFGVGRQRDDQQPDSIPAQGVQRGEH
jgi:hypothetical protein